MKQILFLITILSITAASYAQTFTVDGLEYEVTSTNPNEVTITGGTPATTDLVIPQTVSDGTDTFTVTSVGGDAFRQLGLTSVDFPTTIVTIGGNSFRQNQLSSLVLPVGITSIGQGAFLQNSIQGNLIIPNSVSSLGRFAFLGNQLESVAISNAITSIGEGTFEGNLLTSVTLPTALIEIDVDAFRDNQITSLELPETVTIIRDRAFLNNQISSLVLPDGIVTIGGRSFQNNQIPNLSIPDGITTIENQAFQSNQIATLSLPEGITTIGARSFLSNQITNLILPASITNIEDLAFSNNSLETINALGSTPATIVTGTNDTFGANRLAIDLTIPSGSEAAYEAATWTGFNSINGSDFIVGSTFTENNFNYTVTSIAPNEVEITGGTNVPQDLTIAGTVSSGGSDLTVTRIGNDAFRDNQITTLELPETVTIIRDRAFEGNPLTAIIALGGTPAAIITGTDDTFGTNRGAIDLNIPLGSEATYQAAAWNGFRSVNGIRDFEVGDTFTENNFNYTVLSVTLNEVEITGGTDVPQDLTLEGTVTSQGSDFTVTRIGNEAFREISLATLVLSEGFKEINNAAFRGNQITSVDLPASLTTIGRQAFTDNQITSVILPEELTAIGDQAFVNNSLTSLTLPEGLVSIGINAFENNVISGTLRIPNSVTSIGDESFRNNELNEVIISENITDLGNNTFELNQINVLIIPASVTTIGTRTFGTNPLTQVTPLGMIPPSIFTTTMDTFNGSRGDIALTVPQGTEQDYVDAGWTGFASINEVNRGDITNGYLAFDITSTNPNEVQLREGIFPLNPNIEIPSTVSDGSEDFTVTSIADVAIKASGITSVEIPNTVVATGLDAFSNNDITSVVVPEGIITISKQSFQNNELASINLPNSVTVIDDNAFKSNQLTAVTLPINVNTIGLEAFGENPIRSITSLNPTPPSIEANSFSNRGQINLIVPIGTTQVYLNAGWTGFGNINEVDIVSDFLFYTITGTNPNEVQLIGGTPTGNLEIPATVSKGLEIFTVTSIQGNALGQGDLTSVVLPNTVVSIGTLAFNSNALTSVVLPEGITTISKQSFQFNKLSSIDLPESVMVVDNNAFRNNELTAVTLPINVSDIGIQAFQNNPITEVTSLNTAPPSIANSSFSNRNQITLKVPQGTMQAYINAGWTDFAAIEEIDTGAITSGTLFYEITATSPNEVALVGGAPPLDLTIPSTVSNGSEDFTVTSIADTALAQANLTSVVLPNTVAQTGVAAFSSNALTSVVLPEGITTISKQSFQFNDLGSIDLPTSITVIDNNAFRNNELTAVTLPANVSAIGIQAFQNNPITEVTSLNIIPPSIANSSFSNRNQIIVNVPQGTRQDYIDAGWTDFGAIIEFAFDITDGFLFYKIRANAPTEVEVIGGRPPLDLTIPSTVSNGSEDFIVTFIADNILPERNLTRIVWPNTIAQTGVSAFSSNALTSVVLPEGITTISKQSLQFNQLSSIDLPNSVTVIDNNSFRNNQLTEVILPANVSAIGIQAFQNNPITEVTSLNTEPPSIAGSSFSNRDQITLNVPQGTIAAYEAAGWTDFASIEEFDRGDFTDGILFYDITSTGPNEVQVVGGIPPSDLIIPSTTSNGVEDFTVTSIATSALSGFNLTSVVLPNTITATGFAAFSSNALTSVVIPEGISTISKQSFRNNELGSIDFPNSVTIIDNNAFTNNRLTQVILPANVSAIGIQTFENNPINEVTSFNTEPPSIAGSSFSNRNQIILNVPEGTTQAYIDAGWTDFASIEEFEIDISVAPKVFLQGASLNPIAGEEDLMRDSLRESGLLPTLSPYGDGATVSSTVFDSTGANAIVDWVLIELRSGADNENTTVVTSQAAFIQRDGDIVGLDGTSSITFTEDAGDYFIAIKHRNHIGILTAVPAPLSGAISTLDFTQDAAFAKGENLALTEVNGTFAMIAGDADGSSQILNTDITEGLTLAGGGEDYSNADADMNGFVLNSDIQLLILGNSGTVQQFE